MRINIHNHYFDADCIPQRFAGIATPILKNSFVNKKLTGLLDSVFFWTDKDILSRAATFFRTCSGKNQFEIYQHEKAQYPENWCFVGLPMDMAFMGRGKVKKDYRMQLMEFAEIYANDQHFIPFIHIDSRRANIYELLVEAVEKWGFKGVKLYCNLGYYPTDIDSKIWEYCNAKGLPVIAHCTPDNPVYYTGSNKQLAKLLKVDKLPFKKYRDNIGLFGLPFNYIPLIEKYININWCFAHFGGSENILNYLNNKENTHQYHEQILELLVKYDNVFTDISFTLYESKLHKYIKDLMLDVRYFKKIVGGSDYYMSETEGQESFVFNEYRNNIGMEAFVQQFETNNKTFLGL